jgi:actin-like ATPase involved in cell morphogenesis
LGGIVSSRSVRVAGDSFDAAIVAYVKKHFNLLIGDRTAEEIKFEIGSAHPYDNEGVMSVRGRDLISGLPKNVDISAAHIREALSESVQLVIDAIRQRVLPHDDASADTTDVNTTDADAAEKSVSSSPDADATTTTTTLDAQPTTVIDPDASGSLDPDAAQDGDAPKGGDAR